jgi:hypothetical protein
MITARGLTGMEVRWTVPEPGERHTGTCGFEI